MSFTLRAFFKPLIPISISKGPPINIPSSTFLSLPSISVSSSSIAKYLVTALFKTGESNSVNILDKLPSLGSNTVKSATAPAVIPLAPAFTSVPPTPTPFKNLDGPYIPVINLETASVNWPA